LPFISAGVKIVVNETGEFLTRTFYLLGLGNSVIFIYTLQALFWRGSGHTSFRNDDRDAA